MTKATKKVMQFYFSLKKDRFKLSLQDIADATGLSTKTVQRANAELRDVVISWIPGFGNNYRSGPCSPNEYRLNPDAIWAYQRLQRRQRRQARWAANTPVTNVPTSGHQ